MPTETTMPERIADEIGASLSCTCGDTPMCPGCTFDVDAAAGVIERELAPSRNTNRAIHHEICDAIKRLGGKSDILATVCSRYDTLDDDEVLQFLQDWNNGVKHECICSVDETVELTEQQKMSAGLRELADFLDEQPEFLGHPYFSIMKHVDNREKFLGLARKLGTFEKDVTDEHYNLNRMFGPIKLQIYCDRDVVCTKRLVTKTIEVEEWDCPDHLLSGNGEKESRGE